jgi:glycosyltransferase involved in cell wall biosynthesis
VHSRERRFWRRRAATPTLSVVVPTLNEAQNLEVVLPELADVLEELPGDHEVIVVDGGSLDGTVETARRVLPDAEVVEQARSGKGNAVATGIEQASGDVVVMFDADGSADPAEIPHFVEALTDGADFAKGSRFTEGGGSADITPVRKLGNAFLNQTANAAFGTRFTDLCYGYNAFWADMAPVLDLPDAETPPADESAVEWGDGFEIETVINVRMAAAGAEIAEVPSVERERLHGESNLHAVRDGLRVLRTIVVERLRLRAARRVSGARAATGQSSAAA